MAEEELIGAAKVNADFMSARQKLMDNRKKALKILNDPWWNPEHGAKAKKTFLLVDDSVADGAKFEITNPVCKGYSIERSSIFKQFRGTVFQKVWSWCILYSLIAVIFFVIYKANVHPAHREHGHRSYDGDDDEYERKCSLANLDETDDLKCRPGWFNEQLVAVSGTYKSVARLGKLVLTMFVGLAYKRYIQFYWGSRKVQGAVNNMALILGSVCDYENTSELSIKLQGDLERYLMLVHVLMYMNISPYISDKLSLDDLNKRVMGIDQLLTEEELNIMKYIVEPGSGGVPENAVMMPGAKGNGPMNTVLVWLQMAFDRALAERIILAHHSEARTVSICAQFQGHLCDLRGSMATFGFMKQFPIPLAYAHMMQLLVDVVCLLCPFAVMYEIDTVVVHYAGFREHDPWATLPLTVMGVCFITMFYQGLLELAKVLLNPFGEEIDHTTGELKDKEFMINVKQILKQTRCGQFTFFNSAIAAPACCITETAKATRAEEAKNKVEGADY